MILKTVRLLMYLWFTVLAGDLLYLYYSGSWYDPVLLVEKVEVVVLYCFCLLGLGMFAIELTVRR